VLLRVGMTHRDRGQRAEQKHAAAIHIGWFYAHGII
jgi:hypothetical protein